MMIIVERNPEGMKKMVTFDQPSREVDRKMFFIVFSFLCKDGLNSQIWEFDVIRLKRHRSY